MIILKDISKFYYSDTTATLGLRNINLEFEKGEFVAITGESGSGKSTLLNVISGMDTYEDGELYYNGEETSAYSEEDWDEYRRNKISLIYQSYNLIDSYTALENIESVLLICEKNNGRLTDKERRKKAMECLKMVGLEKQAKNRASHLSSGQKQRLGIARALAKNTDVIIADEPTGNLDIENGKQVMEILHELSKTRLVIVVTHNYEQAEPYATRKVRLFDSEVVENRVLKPKYEVKEEKQEIKKEKKDKDKFFVAKKFVHLNRKATPHRNLFIFSFMLMATLSISVMTGVISKNMDDTTMRIVSDTAFKNADKTRIVVKKIDGSAMTAEDADKLKKIKKVDAVDLYGGVADVNYYCEKDVDYTTTYKNEDFTKSIDIKLLNHTKYMKSATAISQKELAYGRLPEKFNEVVIYADDESILNTTKLFYIRNQKQWGTNACAAYELTIVGILKNKTEQAYFSNELCENAGVRTALVNVMVRACKRETTTYNDGSEPEIFDSDRNISAVLVINPELTGNQIKITRNQFVKLKEPKETEGAVITETIADDAVLTFRNENSNDKTTLDVTVVQNGHIGDSSIVEVSKELYDKVYTYQTNEQSTVYIKNYAYTDSVLKKIDKLGYEAISAFRTSALEYDNEQVAEQFKLMGIAIAAIAIVFVLFIFVVYSLMKLKRADFIILTSLGMSYRTVRQMNYFDLITMVIASDILSIIIVNIMGKINIKSISSLISYFGIWQYVTVVIISVIMTSITAFLFNRHLLKKFKITALKGE